MKSGARVYVAGGDTLVGAALLRGLRADGTVCLLNDTEDTGLVLASAASVDAFFARTRPEYVFLAAGESGGIHTNQAHPARLMLDNLLSACHVMDAAYRNGCRKLLYLGSACCYPVHCAQPMHEAALLTGPPEPTNEHYALAKLAGLKLCQAYRKEFGADYICGIPPNPFGIEDDFDPASSHVIPSLIDRMHRTTCENAAYCDVWGSGAARREFLFADDLADACRFVMDHYSDSAPINLGGGEAMSIAELASAVRDVTGFRGEIRFNTSKPDGMPIKMLDSSKLRAMGWRPRTPFHEALRITYQAYLRKELEIRN